MKKKPVFILSMGDPAGIGPEITIKALSGIRSPYYNVVVAGDLDILRREALRLRGKSAKLFSISDPDEAQVGVINVIDLKEANPGSFELGKTQPQCGAAAFGYIITAIDLVVAKNAAGVITNPISKESLRLAGINYPGHTEIFAQRTKTREYSMIFLLKNVAVAHVTTHCSLRDALNLVEEKGIIRTIRLLYRILQELGFTKPNIAVGGLNPHAGENGLFGFEETEIIGPAVQKAARSGIPVTGPYPADTVFMRAFRGEFNGVVSMLHDHGFVALKSRDFFHGVNITTGLPIIRTSPGHGTAFDIAGKGLACEKSLLSAIDAAWRIYKNRKEL